MKCSSGFVLASLLVAGCGDDTPAADADTSSSGETTSPTATSATTLSTSDTEQTTIDTTTTDPDDTGSEEGSTTGPPEPLESAELPQAVVGGVMFANPDTYPAIPIHVTVVGDADQVVVQVGDATVEATDEDGDGDWIADAGISAAGEGSIEVTATASADGYDDVEATAELVIHRDGLLFTDYDDVGPSRTPMIHRVGDRAFIVWSENVPHEPWLQEIDGAGRRLGDPVQIAPQGAIHVRAAFADDAIGVSYQTEGGGPYFNHLHVVDFDGNVIHSAVDLDPVDESGNNGGDIVYSGDAFVALWRSRGTGPGHVYWLSMDAQSGDTTGPVLVAEEGNSDPHGGFDPFSYVEIEAHEGNTFASFTRGYDTGLGIDVPKSQWASLDAAGTVTGGGFLGSATSNYWHQETHLAKIGDEFVPVLLMTDLNDPNPNPNFEMRAARIDPAAPADPSGDGDLALDYADARNEPFWIGHPDHFAVAAWADHRLYTKSPANGKIVLMAAPINEDLELIDEERVVFEHSVLFNGLSTISLVPAGTNALLSFRDIREDPSRGQIMFETIWL